MEGGQSVLVPSGPERGVRLFHDVLVATVGGSLVGFPGSYLGSFLRG